MCKYKRDVALKGIVFIIMFISLSFNVALAKNFYFSSTGGNDSYSFSQAQSPSTPWKSISKLNEISSQLSPGDSILFKRGEVFYGSIQFKGSGTSSLPIVISSYGNGAKAIISGFTKLDSWTSIGNGIYESANLSGNPSASLVAINGIPHAMGRFPNAGYLSYENSSTNSITSKQLSGSPNWTGADVVMRKNHWILETSPISSQNGNVINFVSTSTYPGISGFGYFIQNDPRTLDSDGEWFFNSKTKSFLMYFGSQSPSNYTIRTPTVKILLTLSKLNNIVVDGLSFEGSNQTAIQVSDAQNIKVLNSDFNFSGNNAITGSSIQGYSSGLKVEGCKINHSNNNAIDLDFSFSNASIRKNLINNTGLAAGMGGSGDGKYLAIYSRGANALIEYNNIDSTGYSGIYFKGSSVVVKNNFVNNSCLVKDDGAGIYTYRDKNDPIEQGQKIVGNIVLNSRGASEGTNPTKTQAHGIYLDGNTMNVDVVGNTAANCTDYGLFMNGSQAINVNGNTFYNNNIQFQMYNWGPGIRNLDVEDNIFFSFSKTQLAIDFYTEANDINKFGHSDKNFFVRPMGDDFLFHTQATANSYPGNLYTLSTWASTYNQDLNSKTTPIKIPDYHVNGLIGKNKVPSDYLTNKNSTAVWPSDNSISIGTNKEGKKALKVSANKKGSGEYFIASILNIGSLSAHKSYVLRYRAISDKDRVVKVYLSQTSAPYANLSDAQFQNISSTAKDAEVVFNSPISDSNARIVFQLAGSDGSINFENIELYEADVKINKPADYIRFEYNATNAVKNISLDKAYVDAKNKSYQNRISLAPFTSVALIASGDLPQKLSQTISFPTLPEKIFKDKPFELAGSSTSGLPLTFKLISGSASIKDSTITLLGAGKIVVEASQEGDEKYNAAAPVTQSFNVKKVQQSLTFPAIPTKNLNDGSFTLSASNSSGLAPSFRVISGPATISGNTITLTDLGTVNIEASQAGNSDYQEASSITQSFSIVNTAVSGTKSAQTIDFSVIPSMNYTAVPFKLNATSSSGLEVKYTVLSGPATISNNVVSLTGPGSVVIQASQSGDSKYQTAFSVVKSFKVLAENASTDKTDQTISFWGVSNKNFDAAPFNLNATSSSGLSVNYRIASGPATISGNTVSLTGAGSVTVECTQDGNEAYNPASAVSQTFNVDKANQHIAFSYIPSKNYGDQPFKLDASSISGLPIVYSVVSGPATISGDEVTLGEPGWVVIKASQEGNENYKMARDVTRNFMINKATQNLSFSRSTAQVVDHVPFALKASTDSGLPVSFNVVSGPAFVSGNMVTVTGQGIVKIEASQPGNQKYGAAAVVQSLEVNHAKGGIGERISPINSKLQLNTFPNPFINRLNIVFTPSLSGYATLKIYDLNGKMIKQLLEANVKVQEPQNFTFDALDNPTGIYVIRLTLAGKTFFQKVILKRLD